MPRCAIGFHYRGLSVSRGLRVLGVAHGPHQRDPGPVGQSSDRLHGLAGPLTLRSRGPDHVPHHRQPPGAAQRARGAVVLGLWLLND